MEPLKPSRVTRIQCFANSASEFDQAQEVSVAQILWIREPTFSISNIGLVLVKHRDSEDKEWVILS